MRLALTVTGGADRSGRERVIPVLLWLVERLARRHDVVIYVLGHHSRPCTYPLLGATVHDLGRPRGLHRKYSALVSALGRDGPFDVVHGYWAVPCGLIAAAAGRRLGIPSVVTLSSGELVSLPAIGYGLQRRWLDRVAVAATLRLATRLVVDTTHMERLARGRGAAPAVIPMGVDTDLFTPADRPEGPPWRLLHVASLNRVKDQPSLLQAFRRLRERVPEVRLDVVGEDTLKGSLQGLARELGVDRHVTFHGFLPSDRLVPLYQQAHLFVLPSLHEAAGIVVLEAAACGVATVGSAVGHVADWAPERAVAVPPAAPEILAAALGDLLADRTRRDRIAAAARAWTVAHDADWSTDQLERLYRDLVTT